MQKSTDTTFCCNIFSRQQLLVLPFTADLLSLFVQHFDSQVKYHFDHLLLAQPRGKLSIGLQKKKTCGKCLLLIAQLRQNDAQYYECSLKISQISSSWYFHMWSLLFLTGVPKRRIFYNLIQDSCQPCPLSDLPTENGNITIKYRMGKIIISSELPLLLWGAFTFFMVMQMPCKFTWNPCHPIIPQVPPASEIILHFSLQHTSKGSRSIKGKWGMGKYLFDMSAITTDHTQR